MRGDNRTVITISTVLTPAALSLFRYVLLLHSASSLVVVPSLCFQMIGFLLAR